MTFSDWNARRRALEILMGNRVSGTFSDMGTIVGGNGTNTIVRRRVVNALLGVQQKRRVFVSYHHGGDRGYYDLFYRTFCGQFDVVQDNSPERRIDSDDAEYVLRRLRENHISGSSCTIVLVGQETFGRRYVDWEIEATLDKQHGLIGVPLPCLPPHFAMPWRLFDNIQSGYALWVGWAQLTLSPTNLPDLIEQANARPKSLINNTRPRRYRSA
jgi:hypothetical protein